MRIALVNTCLMRGRGSDKVVRELAVHLAQSNEVTVFAPFGAELTCEGVELVAPTTSGASGLRRLAHAIEVVRLLRERANEFDVINCHHALLSLFLPSKRLVTTYHGYRGRLHYQLGRNVASRIRRLVSRLLIQPALRRSASTTVVSRSLLPELGISGLHKPLHVIYNGVSLMPDGGTRTDLSPGRHFLYCGRIEHDKSVDVLVKLYAGLGIEVPLILAGDGPLRGELERAFGGARIKFVGMQNARELAVLYRDAIAFVTASTYETFCLPVIEAAMCGCPSVGPDSGAIIEVIKHGSTGYIYHTHEEFRARILELAAMTPDAHRQFGAACREWSRNFLWDHKCAEYVSVFSSAASIK